MLYFDSSALVKLVLPERESSALSVWIPESGEVVSSVLAAVEVPLAARRASGAPAVQLRADAVIAGIDLRELDSEVIRRVRDLPSDLRSLDAIHLATALTLAGEVTAFVAYDLRLVDAAESAGLPVLSPGLGA